MRHIETTNQNTNLNLSIFKEQLGNILQKIDGLNEDDKKEALDYVRNFIEPKPENILSTTIQTTPNTSVRKKSKPPKHRKSTRKRVVVGRLFKCPNCDESKQTKRSLLNHMEMSHIDTPISCMKCRRTFNSNAAFDWHVSYLCRLRKDRKDNKLECSDCSKVFKLRRIYNIHMKAHKRNNCVLCSVVLTKNVELVQHMMEVHQIKLKGRFKCCQCEKCFVKRSSLYHHLQQHYPLNSVCGQCGYVSTAKKDYDEHLKKHLAEKRWKCPYCSDSFVQRHQYFVHLKSHDRYKCLTCNKTFASMKRVYIHKRDGHSVQGLEPKYHCQHCPAAFYRKFLLERHIRHHKDGESITCKFCNRYFRTEQQYFKHCVTASHSKKDPEVMNCMCDHCGVIFTQKYKLDKHLRDLHSSKSHEFVCSYCKYQTYVKANFERHMNLHFSEWNNFICDYCGKTFSTSAVLVDHIKYSHMQERTFKCDECDHRFKRKHELLRHKLSHSDVRPFVCKICERAFKRINHLHRHETTVHSIGYKSKKVQRLKVDAKGAAIPVQPPEKIPKSKHINQKENVNVEPIIETATNGTTEYSIIIPENESSIIINNEVFCYTDLTEQLSTRNELQNLGLVDELLFNSLIIPKDVLTTSQ